MDSLGLKRKRQTSTIKNDVSVQLHKLTIASGDFNNDLHEATKDHQQMYNSMAQRQSDFVSRSILLEEQYRETVAILAGGKKEDGGEASGENIVLPTAYSEDFRKFVEDAKVSLKGHEEFVKEEHEELEKLFLKYEEAWKENLKMMRMRAEAITKQRLKLCSKLYEFVHVVEED